MPQNSGALEQAIARALKTYVGPLQRSAEELQEALKELAAASSTGRLANALPAMLRMQLAAAALNASLDVLGRFVAGSMHAGGSVVLSESAAPAGVPAVGSAAAATPADAGREMGSEGGPVPIPPAEIPTVRVPEPVSAPTEALAPEEIVEEVPVFDVRSLSPDEQELHRRANRVAKVCMQDIKMLRPDEVKAGRGNKDLCARLRVDLDKARKEYERRFKSILHHPVDYFYDWMVDVLADGDSKALGEYPYPSPAHKR